MAREHWLRCVIVVGLGLCASSAGAQSPARAPGSTAGAPASGAGSAPVIGAPEAPASAAGPVVGTPEATARQASAAAPVTATEPAAAPATEAPLLGDEQALYEEEAGTEQTYSRVHPHEERDQNYNFLGVFYQHHFVPSSIIELFVQAAPSFNFPQMGLEYTHRRNNFEIVTSVYYADFKGSGPFLGKDDPATNAEWIDSSLWAVMGSVTFLWSTSFSDWFALEAGVGVGIGALLGNVRRTEAYPTSHGYAACEAPTAAGTPGTAQADQPFVARSPGESVGSYCAPPNHYPSDRDGEDGEHYGINARHWLDGGKVPNLYARVAPQVSLRFKPMHQLVFRIDGGFDIFSGFFVGGAAAVGF
jgi:hypothetical protein